MQLNLWNDLAKAKRRWTEKKGSLLSLLAKRKSGGSQLYDVRDARYWAVCWSILLCSVVSGISLCRGKLTGLRGNLFRSDVAGTGGGSMRASSILWAPTVLVGGTEASGLAALV